LSTTSIAYVYRGGDQWPSLRYRILIPANELGKRGYGVVVSDQPEEADVVVLSKHSEDNWKIAKQAKERGSRVVFDICDDHFDDALNVHYYATCNYADVITVPTRFLQRKVKEKVNRDAEIITDPYEWPEVEPKKPTDKLLWYGMPGNFPALMKELERLDDYKILAITDPSVHRQVTPYSQEAMAEGFASAGIVILPQAKEGKSPNRMVEAIRQGLYVVATPQESYEPYGMWLGDIKEGIEWALGNPQKAKKAVKRAQDIVRNLNSPETVADDWEAVFTKSELYVI
jgi:hypothetical protein